MTIPSTVCCIAPAGCTGEAAGEQPVSTPQFVGAAGLLTTVAAGALRATREGKAG